MLQRVLVTEVCVRMHSRSLRSFSGARRAGELCGSDCEVAAVPLAFLQEGSLQNAQAPGRFGIRAQGAIVVGVILVGVDKSEASGRAVRFACDIANGFGDSVYLVHVIQWSPYSFNTPGENERRSSTKELEMDAAKEQVIDPMAAVAAKVGITVESQVSHGDPVDVIIELAQQRSAVLVVVGRTGDDSRVKRALFGSLPSNLVQVAPVPVTVVP